MTRFAFAALLVCGMFLLHSNARAQCPAASWPTGDQCAGNPWNGPAQGGPVTLWLGSCQVTYTYCWRQCDQDLPGWPVTYYEYVLESVTPVPGCTACDNITPDSMIRALVHVLQTTGDNGGPPPPYCGNDTTLYTVAYAMDCWEDVPYQFNGQWYNSYIACGDPNDYCVTKCEICQQGYNGPYVYSNCSSTSYDDGTCNPLPSPDLWVPNVCYDIQVCGGPN